MASKTNWPEIYQLNKDQIKDPNLIYPGQILRLPDGTTYSVVKGDTLTGIANNFNSSNPNIAVSNSAAGQTAENKVTNDTPQAANGEGTSPSAIADPQPVSNAEAAKINASNDPTTGDTRGAEALASKSKSEAASEAGDNSDKTKHQGAFHCHY